ncbi:hypothetical protein M3Y98_01141700 [Aphelenchoides besseyi]|nr:hypothetical protein M3Y98_01141700 [Aphelenchoides besseyi]KAI6210690.1 hypothetical protein M3Y96_00354700 [Aphelenchoides besseyi]
MMIGEIALVDVALRPFDYEWLPLSTPPTLTDGLILRLKTGSTEYHYFHVKRESENTLVALAVKWSTEFQFVVVTKQFAMFVEKELEAPTVEGEPEIVKNVSLVKYDQQTRELSKHEPTGWQTLVTDKKNTLCVAIGSTLYTVDHDPIKDTSRILTLEMEILKWKSAGVFMNGYADVLATDGHRTLIAYTDYNDVYRFVFKSPDKLGTLAWLRLKQLFIARPEAYDHVATARASHEEVRNRHLVDPKFSVPFRPEILDLVGLKSELEV